MKQIFDEIILIDQNLSDLQNVLAKIDLYKQQCEKDIASKMQKANLCYAQTIEQIEDKKSKSKPHMLKLWRVAGKREKRLKSEARLNIAIVRDRYAATAMQLFKMINELFPGLKMLLPKCRLSWLRK